MRIIVVSGAHSNVGKTRLSRKLCRLLPGAVYIKIGHGEEKQGIDGYFYHLGTTFSTINADHKNASFLVIESNSILKEITPHCAIYLPAENPKPSAELARKKADIIRGNPVSSEKINDLASRLGTTSTMVQKLIDCLERNER